MASLPPLLLLLALAWPLSALSDDMPAVQPLRDVDVTYRVPVPGPGDVSLLQRLRWSVSHHEQRVDLPTSGQWMVLDFATHRMLLVRDAERAVLDLPAPPSAGQPGAGAGFSRLGAGLVAGIACTEWRVTDTRGEQTVACYTADGVLLRATAGERILMQAVSVTYAAQPAELFQPPVGYARQTTSR